jgi:hypothetical protein
MAVKKKKKIRQKKRVRKPARHQLRQRASKSGESKLPPKSPLVVEEPPAEQPSLF